MKRLARLLYKLNQFRWYVTKPITLGVRLLLVKEQTVLLVKHTYQPHWYLPGGGVHRGETLADAVRREAAEEVGAELGALSLFGVYSNFYEHKSDHVALFLCNHYTTTRAESHEIAAVHSFSLDELSVHLSPGTRRRLQEYRSGAPTPIVSAW